jgi:large repetitive protein
MGLKMEDQKPINVESPAAGTLDLPAEMVLLLEQALDRIFLSTENATLPTEEMLVSFIDSFFEYIALDDKAFLEILEKLPEEGEVDSEPNFLNVAFEDLFKIELSEGSSDTSSSTFSGREGGVFGNPVAINISFSEIDTLERRSDVVSVPVFTSQDVSPDVSPIVTAPPPTPQPINTAPITPNIVQLGLETFTINFAPPYYINEGNVFDFGASFNTDGGSVVNAFFVSPVRAGSTEDRTVPGKVTLTQPEGNTLVFYTASIEGYSVGDFVFTLTDPILIDSFPSEDIMMIGDDRYFTYKFVYALYDVDNDVNVGQLYFVIKDDEPVAGDFDPDAITEADIQTIGSNEQVTPEQIISGVITSVTDPNPSYFGANGGTVTNVTLPGGTTLITPTTITVTDQEGNQLVLDRSTGAYTYTLINPFSNTNSIPTTLVFTFELTDNNNNQDTGILTIVIIDDLPFAVDDTGNSDETAFYVSAQVSTGNIFTPNDTFGADGGVINLVNGESSVGGIITAETTYGTIQVYTINIGLNVIGDYIYTVDPTKTKPVNDNLGTVLDEITYQLLDNDGNISNATLTITVDLNQTPTAVNDDYSTNEDTVLNVSAIGVLTNDTDPDGGDTKTVVAVQGVTADVGDVVTLGSGAEVTVNANGSLSYDPRVVYDYLPVGQQATETVTYTVADAEGLTSTATVKFTIIGVNDAPVTMDQSIAATEDGATVTDAFDGDDVDSDDDQASLVYSIVAGLSTSEGSVIVNTDGTFTYDPEDDFQELALGETATVDFTYKATDVHGATSNVSTVTVTLTGVNDAPVTMDQSIAATEDGATVTDAFDGDDVDSDDDQASLVYSIVAGLSTSEGSVIVNTDGTFTYDPEDDFQELALGETATVDFTYKATDVHGATSNVSTVTVTLTGVNDAPVTMDQSIAATEDGATVTDAFDGDDVDSDDDQASLVYSIVAGLSTTEGSVVVNTDGTFTYDPEDDFQELALGETATVDFTYKATDVHGATSNISTVTVTVTGGNDAPVTMDQTVLALEDGPAVTDSFDGDDIDSDNEQNDLIYSIVTPLGTNEGSVIVNTDGTFTYDPDGDFEYLAEDETATVSFTYKATDDHGSTSNVSTVTVTVTGENDAPVTMDQTVLALEDGPAVTDSFDGDDIDSDNDTNDLIYSIVTPLGTNEGSVIVNTDGTFTYDPDGDFEYLAEDETATVSFTYKATDDHGSTSNVSTVTVTVTGENDAPVTMDQTVLALEDGPAVTDSFDGDDIDSDNEQNDLIYSIVTPLGTNEGSVIVNTDGTFTYDPDGDFEYLAEDETATVSFTYKATDDHGSTSNVSTVTVTVTGENDAPVTMDQTVLALEDGPAVTDSFDGDDIDSDNEQNDLIYSIVTPLGTNEGSVIVNTDGTFTYDPDGDFEYLAEDETATVSFTYKATDDHGSTSNVSTVTVTITGENDAPVTMDQNSFSTGRWTCCDGLV